MSRTNRGKECVAGGKLDEGAGSGVDSGYDAAGAAIVTKFAEVDALPGAEVEPTAGDGDGEADAEKGALGMGGHVVESFHGVVVIGFVFANEVVHDLFHIAADVGVGIFVDGQGTGGVLYEEVEEPGLGQRCGQVVEYLTGDEMAAATFGC